MSITRNDIKHIRSLQQKKYRKQFGEFVVEGVKPVEELLRSEIEVKQVFVLESQANAFGECQPEIVSQKDMERMSGLSSAPGVLAWCREKAWSVPEFDGVTLVLDEIRDPGNFGTLVRSAEWFGIRQMVCMPGGVDIWHPKVVQSAMGSIFRMPVMFMEAEELKNHLAHAGIPVYAADMGGQSIEKFQASAKCAIVIGSESHGLSTFWREQADAIISIPGGSGTESLNAAVAGSILMWKLFEGQLRAEH
ncbi:MAG: RNA methyltransferase [Flavobacteriales bacterium]|nr:RNA methyltransferase [Flavobacteriales bacterium]